MPFIYLCLLITCAFFLEPFTVVPFYHCAFILSTHVDYLKSRRHVNLLYYLTLSLGLLGVVGGSAAKGVRHYWRKKNEVIPILTLSCNQVKKMVDKNGKAKFFVEIMPEGYDLWHEKFKDNSSISVNESPRKRQRISQDWFNCIRFRQYK